jgi:hypothetical protein
MERGEVRWRIARALPFIGARGDVEVAAIELRQR